MSSDSKEGRSDDFRSTADSELFMAMIAGSAAAFSEFCRRHLEEIHRYAAFYCWRVGIPDEADAIVNEALVAAIERGSSSPIKKPIAWIRAVVRSRVHDELASRHRENQPLEEEALVSSREDGGSEAEFREGVHMVAKALSRLPQEDQSIITLRMSGLTSQEAADFVGISESAARKKYARGLEKLRITFGESGDRGDSRAS